MVLFSLRDTQLPKIRKFFDQMEKIYGGWGYFLRDYQHSKNESKGWSNDFRWTIPMITEQHHAQCIIGAYGFNGSDIIEYTHNVLFKIVQKALVKFKPVGKVVGKGLLASYTFRFLRLHIFLFSFN